MGWDYILIAAGFVCIVIVIFEKDYWLNQGIGEGPFASKAPTWFGRLVFLILGGILLTSGFLDLFFGHSK
jgi:hypothetical protein